LNPAWADLQFSRAKQLVSAQIQFHEIYKADEILTHFDKIVLEIQIKEGRQVQKR
jgi:hypothetical protein